MAKPVEVHVKEDAPWFEVWGVKHGHVLKELLFKSQDKKECEKNKVFFQKAMAHDVSVVEVKE